MNTSTSPQTCSLIIRDGAASSSITDLVDFIIVRVGERYDFVLEANQAVDNYLMLAETLEDPVILMDRGYCLKAHRVYGVLHYDGASDNLPVNFDESYDPLTRCDPSNQCFALNCPYENYPSSYNIQCISVVELELTDREPVPNEDVNPSVFLNFGFSSLGPSINNRVYENPHSPLLSQPNDTPQVSFCAAEDSQPTQPPLPTDLPIGERVAEVCVHTYTVTTDTVEMVYTNLATDGAAHPIHLHGHHYFVMNIGYPTYYTNGTVNTRNMDIDCGSGGCNEGLRWASGSAPLSSCATSQTCPMKDTVIVPVGGYVQIRFPRNNWGWWIMHCHIEPHLLGGMAMVVNETSAPGNFPIPEGFPKCGQFENSGASDGSPYESTEEPSPTVSPMTGGLMGQGGDLDTYRDATIALGVISAILLSALIAVIVAWIVTCLFFRRGGSDGGKPKTVEVEMQVTARAPEVEVVQPAVETTTST